MNTDVTSVLLFIQGQRCFYACYCVYLWNGKSFRIAFVMTNLWSVQIFNSLGIYENLALSLNYFDWTITVLGSVSGVWDSRNYILLSRAVILIIWEELFCQYREIPVQSISTTYQMWFWLWFIQFKSLYGVGLLIISWLYSSSLRRHITTQLPRSCSTDW